jgi:hypothetical protein
MDYRVGLQRTVKPFPLELKERIKAEATKAASASIGEDLDRQLKDRLDELETVAASKENRYRLVEDSERRTTAVAERTESQASEVAVAGRKSSRSFEV